MTPEAKLAAITAIIDFLAAIGEDPNTVTSINFRAPHQVTIAHTHKVGGTLVDHDIYVPTTQRQALIDERFPVKEATA